MRVLHIQKVVGTGGSERHLLDLLPGLADRGIDVRMCVLAAGGFRSFVDPLRARGIDVVTMPSGPDVDPVMMYRIAREIRAFRPDLLHTHLIHADTHGQAVARLLGVPGVSSFHSTNPFLRRHVYRLAESGAERSARRTIAISRHVARFLASARLANPRRVRTIPYGIDVGAWGSDDGERKRTRGSLGLGDGEVAFGVASRLVPFKGHDFVLRSTARALARGATAWLLVAGDGPLRAGLERQASALTREGAVRFLGHVEDVRAFMRACDVMLFPSLPRFGEGFGLAALESMAAERPVIATGIDSLPEIVVPEETGVLVTPDDDRELASAITRLAGDADLRRRMGVAGFERARDVFALDRMVEKTIDVYRELL